MIAKEWQVPGPFLRLLWNKVIKSGFFLSLFHIWFVCVVASCNDEVDKAPHIKQGMRVFFLTNSTERIQIYTAMP